MKTAAIAIALVLAVSTLNAFAQDPGGTPPAGGGIGGGPRHGQGGQHQRPSPEQIAAQLMKDFDANKDGELSQDELTQALKALRKHHQRGPGGGALQGGQGGHRGPASGGGQQGAGQGGLGGGHQAPPSAEKVAARMIEKYSSDKKGLTQAELAKAIAEHRASRGQHGGRGQQGGGHPGGPGGASGV